MPSFDVVSEANQVEVKNAVEQANKVLSGPVGKEFLEMLPRHNLVGLGWLSVMALHCSLTLCST